MSMEHKAFLFDTQLYHAQLEELLLHCGETDDPQPLAAFIDQNLERMRSPYTADTLDTGWRQELTGDSVQELADFALTLCYDPEADIGMGPDWEDLCYAMEDIGLDGDSEYYFVGGEIQSGSFVLDPGGMGFGIIEPEDIPLIYDELERFYPQFARDEEELAESYRTLMEIYETARSHSRGLMLTF